MKNKTDDLDSKGLQTFAFEGSAEKFSLFQPINVKPTFGQDWILNGSDNANYKTYTDAYNDSPTNSAIIDAYVAYMYGEGLIDLKTGESLSQYVSSEDMLLLCNNFKTYGGCGVQVIWDEKTKKPIRLKFVPIYKLGVKYNQTNFEIDGYWFSYDWTSRFRYQPQFYPKFKGIWQGNAVEVLVIRRPTAEPFFSIPDYISGIPWARVEGELSNSALNHFKNGLAAMTVINYNQGRQESTELARTEANKVRKMVTGSDNTGGVIVSFNDSAEESVTIDQLHPPELNTQNVFYAEEAERKIKIAHSAPPILFSGSTEGGGFSNNADEIAVATKMLYRKQINPMRDIVCNGLASIFKLIDANISPWFKDFEEETKLENND